MPPLHADKLHYPIHMHSSGLPPSPSSIPSSSIIFPISRATYDLKSHCNPIPPAVSPASVLHVQCCELSGPEKFRHATYFFLHSYIYSKQRGCTKYDIRTHVHCWQFFFFSSFPLLTMKRICFWAQHELRGAVCYFRTVHTVGHENNNNIAL